MTMKKSQSGLLTNPAFTIIEMMVSVAIIAIITVVVVINFRAGRQRDELRDGAMHIVSLIQQAQTYALAGKTVDYGGNFVGPPGWGLSISPQDDVIYFFADSPRDINNWYGDGIFGEDDKNFFYEQFNLAEYNITIDDDTNNEPPAFCVRTSPEPDNCAPDAKTADYIFSLPLANRHINDNEGYPNPNKGGFSLIIRHSIQTNIFISLTVDAATGQIVLGPIESSP